MYYSNTEILPILFLLPVANARETLKKFLIFYKKLYDVDFGTTSLSAQLTGIDILEF